MEKFVLVLIVLWVFVALLNKRDVNNWLATIISNGFLKMELKKLMVSS